MAEKITLTIDEIHDIREAHYEKTKDMSFEEYKKSLDEEIAPILDLLKAKKNPANVA